MTSELSRYHLKMMSLKHEQAEVLILNPDIPTSGKVLVVEGCPTSTILSVAFPPRR